MMNILKESSKHLKKHNDKEYEAENLFERLVLDICTKYDVKLFENRIHFNENYDGNYNVTLAGDLSEKDIREINSILYTECKISDKKYFKTYFFESDYEGYHGDSFQ